MLKENKQPWWLLIVLGGMIPLVITLGQVYELDTEVTIIFVVSAALIFASTCLWMNANAKVTGDEWWQDNSASGWRGY